jgi:hypothetical protein
MTLRQDRCPDLRAARESRMGTGGYRMTIDNHRHLHLRSSAGVNTDEDQKTVCICVNLWFDAMDFPIEEAVRPRA